MEDELNVCLVDKLFNMNKNSFIEWHRPPKCIVLDLDETLIHSFPPNSFPSKSNQFKKGRTVIHNINIDGENWNVVERPHLQDFLKFIYTYFDVIVVWSAGTYEYVHEICKKIINYYDECIVYTRDDCISRNNTYIKPLTILENNEYILKPIMNMNTMFVVDNLEDTFVENVNNAIHIPNFEPTVEQLNTVQDLALLKLMHYFSNIDRTINDIRVLDKNIFY